MQYPTFSADSVPTVTFSRGPAYGPDHEDIPSQIIGISQGKQVRVATLSDPEELLPLAFELLPLEDITAVRAFLNDPLVNWAANAFVYTDVTGTAWTVRCLNATFPRAQTSGGRYSASFALRKENA